jgi:uncharacterized repeat protein (TIGR03806 family)
MPFRRVLIFLLTIVASACGESGGGSFPDISSPDVVHSGLEQRPVNTQCVATNFRQPAAIRLERVPLSPARNFAQPLGIFPLPGNNDVFFVPQQNGVIWRLERENDEFAVNEFVDLREFYNVVYSPLSCHECGLYGIAPHPDFENTGYIYLSFTEGGTGGNPLHSYIARFRSADGGKSLVFDDTETPERVDIYDVRQPQNIHNNGHIAFGPDGYLYASFGDGGPGGDPDNNAQNVNNPFGSILRLTDTGDPAPDNRFPDGGLPEIFAYGLRNPWRWSFDRLNGELWAGDVGQEKNEEINLIVNGGNYGWRCFEGLEPYDSCGGSGPFIQPLLDYGRADGVSITGGYVYRGGDIPGLQGVYIFGDFGSGLIWGLFPQEGGGYQRIRLLASGRMISSFGEDNDGELYLSDYAGGGIYRIRDAGHAAAMPLPARLSATGCVDPADPTQPASGLIPYAINESFWSDNAEKERFIGLPDAGRITVEPDGDFVFPVGTVLMKSFRLHGRLIETRLLLNQPDTGWNGYSYQWNEAQTDATLLNGGLETPIDGQLWRYPSGAECSQCHTAAAGFSLGPEARQLNRDFTYPSTGLTANQLDTFETIGLFASALGAGTRALTLPRSEDETRPLAARARSYLHSNCSNCHRPGGVSQSAMDLRFDVAPEFMNLCNAPPLQGDLGIADARLLAPGDPERSVLWHRIGLQNEYRMPPVASTVIDSAGALLIHDWIGSLNACNTVVGPIDAAYNIGNRATGGYIHVQNGLPQAGPIETGWLGARWAIEPAETPYFRIRSITNPGHYLHLETLPLQSGVIENGWLSAQWELIPVGDYFRIRNQWRNNHYLHVESGNLRAGAVDSDSLAAQWRFERVE